MTFEHGVIVGAMVTTLGLMVWAIIDRVREQR